MSVCGEDYIGKGGRDNPEGVDNPGKGPNTPDLDDKDGKTNDLGTGTDTSVTDIIERRVDNSCKSINIPDTDNTNQEANNPGKNIHILEADVDGRADNPGIGTNIPNADTNRRADNPGIKSVDADGQVVASDKARASFFSLSKAFFFISFSEQEAVSASLASVFTFFIVSSNLSEVKSPFFQIPSGQNMHV